MSKKDVAANEALALGAMPRVHLLPPEVEAKQRARGVRRLLFMGLAAVVVLVIVGIGVATVSVFASNASLTAEQQRTTSLLAEQRKYSSVTTVQGQVNDIKAAEILAASGEIAWEPYVQTIQGTLTPGMSITSFDGTLNTAGEQSVPSTNPLVGTHIATIKLSVETPQSSISDWLDSLAKLKGFVDATPGTVQVNVATGNYDVDVVMHVGEDALSNRFKAGK